MRISAPTTIARCGIRLHPSRCGTPRKSGRLHPPGSKPGGFICARALGKTGNRRQKSASYQGVGRSRSRSTELRLKGATRVACYITRRLGNTGGKPWPAFYAFLGAEVTDDTGWPLLSLEEKVEHLHAKLNDTISTQVATEFRDNIVQIVNAFERNLAELRQQTGFSRGS
jgi:hypothetical protein